MKNVTKVIAAAALLAGLVFSAPAMAQNARQAPATDEARVVFLLSGHHDASSREALEDATPDARTIVLELAETSESAFHRDRALLAAGYWADAEVLALYAKTVKDTKTREMTRHRVMMRAAEAFGDEAVSMLVDALSSDDIQLRMTAVAALGLVGTDKAHRALAMHAEREKSQAVQSALESARRRVK